MADIISLQELADAKLDAKSLEQFINGGVDEDVLTRLSQQYPTIKKLLLEFQRYNGRAYKTYAEMDADKANLPSKSKVTVTNDATASNNGDWQWDGEVLTKSLHDVLLQSKMYTVQTVNGAENQLNDIYLSLLKFFIQYETDFSNLLSKASRINQYSFNQKVIDLFMNIDSIHKNSRSGNQDITAFYALFYELNKLDGIDLANLKSNAVATSFAADMHVPSDKFGVEKGDLKGLVLKPSVTQTDFDSLEVESPYIIYDEKLKKYVMVYTAYGQGHSSGIGWATSDDLLVWTKQGKLFSPSGIELNGDRYGTTGPCIYYYKGLYYLYYLGLNGQGYEGEPINMCLATTPSLTNPDWTYHGIKIPIQSQINWANEAIYHPNLFTFNNKWYMFFNARGNIDGVVAERFGYATSDAIDGKWAVSEQRVSEPLEINQTFIRAGDPAVFEYGGLIYVFYFSILDSGKAIDHWGWTTPAEFPNNWRFGGDLLNNTPSYQNAYAHKPFVVKKDNVLYHYYTAVGDQGRCIALKTYDI